MALTEAELQGLADQALKAWPDDGWAWSYRAMVLFAGYVGLRPGELFALQRANVAGDLCLIERALESKSGTIGPTKNGRSRTVTVPPVARDAIADLPRNASGLLFESPRRPDVAAAVAPSPLEGRALDGRVVRVWTSTSCATARRRCCSNEG